mmetsp:Transcript_21448/g.54781  ORF Transcript_21448/g.54781 Transcript_21448/m.54781 type:complete len:368 (-) Transcript_21448:147-1250(-)|eukprot:CAMPEP_0183439436 /NCGR_PEP_ID=MMETSP0370-20130417/78159_1 /TAXON_ID=268820 /ORGANISM="Peridinium aciculiferum, Strain PAER-2" /LENGTH=367 /DNA_ID=CAMNT_0025627919 /DNA_START=44 /DNA_END=1147 /DNA_ORIENTATION=+
MTEGPCFCRCDRDETMCTGVMRRSGVRSPHRRRMFTRVVAVVVVASSALAAKFLPAFVGGIDFGRWPRPSQPHQMLGAPQTRWRAWRALPSESGPFLTEMKTKFPTAPGDSDLVRIRRKRMQIFEDGKWNVIPPPKEEVEPSESPEKLAQQLFEARKYGDLLPFLEKVVPMPSFSVLHVLIAVDVLWGYVRTGHLAREREFEDKFNVAEHPGPAMLAERGMELFEEAPLGSISATSVVKGYTAIAEIGRYCPQLRAALLGPLARHALHWADSMNTELGAATFIATSKTWAHLVDEDPELPLDILRHFDRFRLRKMQGQLQTYGKEVLDAGLRKAVFFLRRDYPYLRDYLPEFAFSGVRLKGRPLSSE